MRTHPHSSCPDAANRRCRGLSCAGLTLALAMAFPGAAHPYDLKQLLELPLERLLALEITSRRVATLAEQRAAVPADRAIDEGDHAP